MKISINGWARDHGERVLLSGSVTNKAIDEEVSSYAKGRVYVDKIFWGSPESRNAKLRIRTHAALSGINGDYLTTVELTRDELDVLFCYMYKDVSLGEVVQRISETLNSPDRGDIGKFSGLKLVE